MRVKPIAVVFLLILALRTAAAESIFSQDLRACDGQPEGTVPYGKTDWGIDDETMQMNWEVASKSGAADLSVVTFLAQVRQFFVHGSTVTATCKSDRSCLNVIKSGMSGAEQSYPTSYRVINCTSNESAERLAASFRAHFRISAPPPK